MRLSGYQKIKEFEMTSGHDPGHLIAPGPQKTPQRGSSVLDQVLTDHALAPQQRDLSKAGKMPHITEDLELRSKVLRQHVEGLSRGQRVGMIAKHLAGRAMPQRRWAMRAILPASWIDKKQMGAQAEEFCAARSPEHWQDVSLITEDHVQLSGLLYRRDPLKPSDKVVALALPNAMPMASFAEDNFYFVSMHHGADVLGVDYRGVGASLGIANSTGDLVKDFRAVIERTHSMGYAKRDVAGVSLGGGVAVQALASLQREQRPSGQQVGQLSLHHTFRSLSAVPEAHFGKAVGALFGASLTGLQFDGLDSEKTLGTQRLAGRLVVTSPEHDNVVVPRAALQPTHRLGLAHCDLDGFVQPLS